MRLPDVGVALAVTGAVCLRWDPGAIDLKTSFHRTRADTVVCERPFQIRKAIVAMAQDDGARIRSLACTRPGAGKRVRIVSIPSFGYGPWEIRLISEEGVAISMRGFADQFEADGDG